MIVPTLTKPDLAVPACTTFTGAIELLDGKEANFDGYEAINGNLVVYQESPRSEISIHSDTLRDLNGTLVLGPSHSTLATTNLGDVDVSFPVLEHITGLLVGGPFAEVKFSLGPTTTLDYVRITGVLEADPALYLNVTTLSGLLDNASGDQIGYNEVQAFYSPLVLLNTSLWMGQNLFTSIEFPNVETVRMLAITENKDLETIAIAARSAMGFQFSVNGRKTVAELPRLTNITGEDEGRSGYMSIFANLVGLQLPVLREVNSRVYSIQFLDNLFAELNLPPAVPRTPSTPTEVEDSADGGDGRGGEKTGGDEQSGEGQHSNGGKGGLSTGAKAGIGAGAGVGGLVAVVGGLLLFLKKKKKGTGDVGTAGGGGGSGGTAEEGKVPEADGRALPPASPSPVETALDDKTLVAEADSKALEGAELDSHPREQAGTREELDNKPVRAELLSATARGTGVVELPA